MDEMRPVAHPLVPGRECGSCNACCVHLTIDDPELRKVQGVRCRHALPDNGCAIYETRPRTCRTFYCGWRMLKWVKEALRPDRSGVLIRLQVDRASGKTGVNVTLLTRASARAEGLAETVAAAVNADLPVYLSVPGPPGYTSGMARINEALEGAVVARDKKAVLRILRQARAQGVHGDHQAIVFKRTTDGVVTAGPESKRK
jgi:hypothetical protein